MKRPDAKLLLDMLHSAQLAVGYLADRNQATFESDALLQDAVARRLEVLGEAAARVTEETRSTYPDLPWREMVGMRNRIVHEYFQVDLEVVWKVVRQELQHLIERLRTITEAVDDPESR
jgi:uncharacterized protein with HEPN domain